MAIRRSCRRALRHAEPSFRHPQGHNQRENKTLIRYYQRAYDEGEEETAVRVPVEEQIARARTLYSGRSLERALKLAASA